MVLLELENVITKTVLFTPVRDVWKAGCMSNVNGFIVSRPEEIPGFGRVVSLF